MIPEAAVEAAARAFHGNAWDAVPAADLKYARAALEVAAPHIAAQALRDAVQAFPLETITAPDNAVVWLMRRAEKLEAQ